MLTSQDIQAAGLGRAPGERRVNETWGSLSPAPPCNWPMVQFMAAQLFLTRPDNSKKFLELLTGWKFFAQTHLESVALSGNPAVISQKGRLPMNYSTLSKSGAPFQHLFSDPLITEAKKKEEEEERRRKKENKSFCFHQDSSPPNSFHCCKSEPTRVSNATIQELKIKVPSKKHTDASITSNPDQRAQPQMRGQDKRPCDPLCQQKYVFNWKQFRENCIFGNGHLHYVVQTHSYSQRLPGNTSQRLVLNPRLLSWKNDSSTWGPSAHWTHVPFTSHVPTASGHFRCVSNNIQTWLSPDRCPNLLNDTIFYNFT